MANKKRRTARQIFLNGTSKDFDAEHIVEIIENLYKTKLAHAFFVGMGWPEGYNYCDNSNYARLTVAEGVLAKDENGNMNSERWRPYWFACRFFED